MDAGALFDLPLPAVAAIALLVLAQLTLQAVALIDLARRRPEQVTGGKRWVWALVIVLGELIGAVIYLAAGRTTPPAEQPAPERDMREASERAADELYGRRDA